ncbi:GFA family protein [Methylocystis bryophila]|uniref:Aldehyde-activating protein n=1 Tax=Methylocystis bryophila TaxID=655015 RepID=A0A1W6MR66_9HYPH|nr:GFA family protein [Methylocystis bryophila]ARN80091.1 aldehyde-activating protein [Methylocystis bryophila]BDV40019.1 aldehyde-activating protein [Methylocystis bryophila]
MDLDTQTIDGACHCKTVRFRVRLTDGLHTARRCTCSYCRMRGAIAVSADLEGVDILAGSEALSTYTFNTRAAKHFFCSRCGIYTHHQRRSKPNQFGVNVACLEGVSPFDFDDVIVYDGANHPEDAYSSPPRVAGHLKFVRA